MSLEELNGPILHLVLSIKGGHGFGFLQTPMVVVASTSNLCLETEPIQPCPDPIIRTDLAWETDKKSLRGFRTSNTPVKVECFSVLNDVKRDRIGYILLNIKSAQVVPSGKHTKLLEKCHRLISVPQEAKLMKPELLLCLKITEANAPVSTCPSTSSGLSKTQAESPQSGWTSSVPVPQADDVSLLPIFRPNENLVQIGTEDSCSDSFIFTLTIDNVGNLSLLSPKKSELSTDGPKSIHINCGIFSTILSTQTINGEFENGGDSRLMGERMQVRLFSSVPILFRYFRENPTCTLQLYVNGREIAATELHLTSFLRTDNKTQFLKDNQSFCSKSQQCPWISSFTATIPAAPSGGKPFIDITTRLSIASNEGFRFGNKIQHLNSNFENQIPTENSVQTTEHPSFATQASSRDCEPVNNERILPVLINNRTDIHSTELKEDTLKISDSQVESFRIGSLSDFHPNRPGVRNTPFISVNPLIDKSTAVHKYCLRVLLQGVIFDEGPVSKRLRFRFEYPDGHVLTSSITDVVSPRKPEALELADIGAAIVLHASPSVVVSELRTCAVQVTVAEVQKDLSLITPFARASLPISSVCLPGKVESPVTAVLEGETLRQRIGIIHALLSLEDYGPRLVPSVRFQPHTPDSSVQRGGPPILHNPPDSSKMAHVIGELENWKEKQMEIFTSELKEKEALFLERASETWNERKRQIEENLESNMEQCRSLSQALSAAREELRERSKSCREKEEELNQLKDDLEKQYNVKFQELTSAAEQLDQGVKMKVILTETRCSELKERVKALATENGKLRHEIEEERTLRRELIEKTELEKQSIGLNQQQVAKLLAQVKQLEEKLRVSMKTKVYFKEQWGRAIREANMSRSSNFKSSSMESSLENAGDPFLPFGSKGLEHILLQEEEELKRDSEALELLRRQIGDVSKRKIDV